MTTIQVEVPDSVFLALRESPAEVARDIRVAAAASWFARGLVSQGRAAELAGVSRWEFLEELGRRGIPAINITLDDLREELREIAGEE
jgi:predicted HTH domain antitoxin